MTQQNRSDEYETFAEALKNSILALLIPALLVVAVLTLSAVIRSVKSSSELFHSDLQPKMPELHPIETEELEGVGAVGTILTETTPVDDSYFADALFVGDSLCDGVRVYTQVFPGYRTATKVGLGIDALLYQPFASVTDGENLSAIDHVSTIKPSKLYIMIGTNDLVWNDPAKMAESYGAFIDEVLARLPGCKIVVESIPPTTARTAAQRPMMSAERITAYNEHLKQLAIDKGVYFLDVHSVIVGADGYMPEEIAANDGYHMNASGYQLWCNYMKSHPIQSDASFSIGADGRIQYTQTEQPAAAQDSEPQPPAE